MVSSQVPMVALNDGAAIPQVGFGVFQIAPVDTKAAVLTALEAGYRHIDTAEMYGNEQGVGEAIAESGVPRSEVFVTSKLHNRDHDSVAARDAGKRSADLLGGYMDLFLVHWPLAMLSDPVPTWEALLQLRDDGLTRSAGVSNFQRDHLQALIERSGVVPAANQIEVHPYLTQDSLRAFGAGHGIVTEAWSPLAQGMVLDDPTILEVAQRHGKSPAQVTLRWHLQRGDIVFPKSVTRHRVVENLALFDFNLDAQEIAEIAALDRGHRTGPDPDTFDLIPD